MKQISMSSAQQQYWTRPDDERYWDLAELAEASRRRELQSVEYALSMRDLSVEPGEGSKGIVVNVGGQAATFTHFSFDQFCTKLGAQGAFMRKLPASHIAGDLNYLMKQTPDEQVQALLTYGEGNTPFLRCLTGGKFERLWDNRVCNMMRERFPSSQGWRTPVAWASGDTPASRTRIFTPDMHYDGTLVRVGEKIQPSGVYAGDRDMFAFQINPNRYFTDAKGNGLMGGVFVTQSEVGVKSFYIQTFMERMVCGNHMIIGVERIECRRTKHVGDVELRVRGLIEDASTRYWEANWQAQQALIAAAAKKKIGKDKDEVVQVVFAKLRAIGRKDAINAFELGMQGGNIEDDGHPTTVWGYVNALTRYSQRFHTDKMMELNEGGSKILQIAA